MDNGDDSVGGSDLLSGLELLSRDLAGLDLLGVSGQEDELRLVLLELADVDLESLNRLVLSAGINGNADRQGLGVDDAGSLELLARETAASTDLAVVLDGVGTDGRSQQVQRSGSNGSSLLSTSSSSAGLLTGLVQVDTDTLLPVLSEVVLNNGVVLLDS